MRVDSSNGTSPSSYFFSELSDEDMPTDPDGSIIYAYATSSDSEMSHVSGSFSDDSLSHISASVSNDSMPSSPAHSPVSERCTEAFFRMPQERVGRFSRIDTSLDQPRGAMIQKMSKAADDQLRKEFPKVKEIVASIRLGGDIEKAYEDAGNYLELTDLAPIMKAFVKVKAFNKVQSLLDRLGDKAYVQDLPRAFRCCDRNCRKLSPECTQIVMAMARDLVKQGHFSEAIACVQKYELDEPYVRTLACDFAHKVCDWFPAEEDSDRAVVEFAYQANKISNPHFRQVAIEAGGAIFLYNRGTFDADWLQKQL